MSRRFVFAILSLLPGQALALTENFVPSGGDYAFYAFALSGIVFSAVIIAAYREYKWLGYTFFSALLLLHLASMDGMLVYLIEGDDFVLWVVPFLVQAITACYGYLLIASRIEAPHRFIKMRRSLYCLAVLSAVFPLSSPLWLKEINLELMWRPVNLLFFGMVAAMVMPPMTWQSTSRLQTLFIRAFPIVVGLFTIGAYLLQEIFLHSAQTEVNFVHRGLVVLFAFFSLTIVIWQAFNAAQAREDAEKDALEAARKEAETRAALAESQQEYVRARQLAARNLEQLQSVSHDLRQPITALRVAIEQLQNEEDGEDSDKLARAVDYIDSLAQAYVQPAADDFEELKDHVMASAEDVELVDATLYTDTLLTMFASEALKNNVELRAIASSARISTEPLSTMRVMNNLIANAIMHSGANRVLFGFRRGKDTVTFQVLDNGRGMSNDKLTELMDTAAGPNAEGHGLGLNIVQALCKHHNTPFAITSEPGRGTWASVTFPAAI